MRKVVKVMEIFPRPTSQPVKKGGGVRKVAKVVQRCTTNPHHSPVLFHTLLEGFTSNYAGKRE